MAIGELLRISQPEYYCVDRTLGESDLDNDLLSDEESDDYEQLINQIDVKEPEDDIPQNIEIPNALRTRTRIFGEHKYFSAPHEDESTDGVYCKEFEKQIQTFLRERRLQLSESSDIPRGTQISLYYESLCKPIRIFNYIIIIGFKDSIGPETAERFHKTMWLLMKFSTHLTLNDKIYVLKLLAGFRQYGSMREDYSGVIRSFLCNLMDQMKRWQSSEYSHLHKFFGELANDGYPIKEIVHLRFVLNLNTHLKNLPAVKIVQLLLELLALICANCNRSAELLLKNGIEVTLAYIEKIYYSSENMLKIPILKLVFSLMPVMEDTHSFLRDEIKTESCHDRTWGRMTGTDWIPFEPKISFAIHKALQNKRKQITVAESRVIKTIDLEHMLIVDESTSKWQKIKYVSSIYSLIEIRKEPSLNGLITVEFFKFAILFLVKAFCESQVRLEKLYSTKILMSLLQYAKQFQLKTKVLCQNEDLSVEFTVSEMTHRMLEDQILSLLRRREAKLFRYMNKLGIPDVRPIGDNSFEERTIEETDERERYPEYNPHSSSFQQMNEEDRYHTFRKFRKLDYYRAVLTKPSPGIKDSNEAMRYLLKLFTSAKTLEMKLKNLRIFLKMFANIPLEPNSEPFEIQTKPFEDAVSSLGRIMNRFEVETLKPPERYQYGLNTIKALAERRFFINFQLPDDVMYDITVHPFTTIQFLEGNIFSRYSTLRDVGYTPDIKLKFTLNGVLLPSLITVYEAIHRFGTVSGRSENLFGKSYQFSGSVVKTRHPPLNACPDKSSIIEYYFRKRIPVPKKNSEISERMMMAIQLTDILFGINMHWSTAYSEIRKRKPLIDPGMFVQTKLDRMLQDHLVDPFGVLVGRLDAWRFMVGNCPFIFSLGTRKLAFRVFSLSRRIALNTVLDAYPDTRLENFDFSPIRIIDRNRPYEEVTSLLRSTLPYTSWEVQFRNETGDGQGLLCELFSIVGKYLQSSELGIWSSKVSTSSANGGLYPKTKIPTNVQNMEDLNGDKIFLIIGQLLGKALVQNVVFDLPLAPSVFNWLLGKQALLDIDDIKYVNPYVHKVLMFLSDMAEKIDQIRQNENLLPHEKDELVDNLKIDGCNIESYDLDFVLPGNENIELIPGGSETQVNRFNVHKYLEEVKKLLLQTGVFSQMYQLKKGFKYIIDYSGVRMFQPEELMEMVCGCQDDSKYWSLENLKSHISLDNCTLEDQVVIDFLDIISTATEEKRRAFLEFVTSCPKLPSGGFKYLDPPFTIKMEPSINYPFARTCFNALILPTEFDRNQLEAFFELAITEGLNHFGLA